ncbi:hypothetical protein MKX03_028504 [Papaver bracteatum]|nr:hypothetical protein MKX03_028504 [Papaver bracteatum]
MSSTSSLFFLFTTVLIISSFISKTVEALVPKSKTFKYVNQGDLAYPAAEYGVPCRSTGVVNDPFYLMFYSTGATSEGVNSYTYSLGIAMTTRDFQDLGSPFRWVWAANRGKPVHENATLTFGVNGNLVLAESSGVVVWQTGTANKGVVELKLLRNGNLVLLNKNGGFVWQSFDHPSDALLVGQSLLQGGKLVNGRYSMVLEDRKLGFYYNNGGASKNKPNGMIYNEIILQWDESKVTGKLKKVTFDHLSEGTKQEPRTDLLRLLYYNNTDAWGSIDLAQQKYNSTLSFLRLGSNGDLIIYTLYDVRRYYVGQDFSPWELTYSSDSQCQLPDKCGSFGLCENNLCIACPTPNGLKKWNKECKPSKVPSCSGKISTSDLIKNTKYYKLENVDHFMSKYVKEGPMKMDDCKKKCSEECKCVGFFYTKGSSMCLITTQLDTLIKGNFDEPGSHLAFIKY